MKKLLRFAGVVLLALTIGVFGCGDDEPPVAPTVTVTPPTPTPPPFTTTMAPASAEVAVGSSVVFAVNASGGAADATASWVCTSSDEAIATASTTATGCQATGVAAGGVTINATVTKGSETSNVGSQLTVTAPPGPPPFEASIAPESVTVAVGSSAVFAINTSGGAADATASWVCTSSDEAIATATTTEVGCEATGVAGGEVTINVVATDGHDTINLVAQLTVSTDPVDPPAPFAAMMSPESADVAVGSNVVFAINTSGGAADATAIWVCTSSDEAIATASETDAGCQATGVAAGGVTINAAVTKGDESASLASQLTVTALQTGTPAFVVITMITGDEESGTSGLIGRVTVAINVERGDQMIVGLSLKVDGEVVDRSFGSAAAAPARQAVHPFELSFDTQGYDSEGTPAYKNDMEHTVVAELTVAESDDPISSLPVAVQFANEDGVHVTVNGLGDGAMNSETGQMWYGGPAVKMIEITAVPVLYSGSSVTSVGMRAFCRADAATDDEAPFMFTPECKGTTDADGDGEKLEFTIAGAIVGIRNSDDMPALYLDFEGPSAPTFFPNPNGREGGWVNLAEGLRGEQKTSNKDGWLTYNDDDAGVGGYIPQLRYAEVPKMGDGDAIDVARDAPILTLSNLPEESEKADAYCAVASALDRLGNQSKLPNAADHATAAGECVMAGVASDVDVDADPMVEARGYHLLLENLENATDDDTKDEAKKILANRGLLVGVDITPPAVEFTAGGPKDEATSLGEGWVLYVTDGGSGLLADPIDASIEVRDGDGTEDVDEVEEETDTDADGLFMITPNNTDDPTRFTTRIQEPAVGYHTFSATATDKAGNETDSGSRVALHDVTLPTPVRLFVAPGADAFTYDKTLLATDDLSIASYAITVPVAVSGVDNAEIKLGSMTVDRYNASSLTPDLLKRDPPVVLPFLAVQDANGMRTAITAIKAYVSDQVGAADGVESGSGDIATPDDDDIPEVEFRTDEEGFGVTATDGGDNGNTTITDGDATIELEATADLSDASTDFPFSRVDFYVAVEVMDGDANITELRFIKSVAGNRATPKTLETAGRVWTYAAEVDAAAFLAVVDEDEYMMGNVVAFGVSTAKDGSVAVAAVSAELNVDER